MEHTTPHTTPSKPATPAATPAAAPADSPADAPVDAPICRDILRALTDMAAQLACQIHQHLTAPSSPAHAIAPDHAGLAFECVAAAARRAVTLAISLPSPTDTRDPQQRAAARKLLLQHVEAAIRHKAATQTPASFHANLQARTRADDIEDDLARRPITEIIAEICCDLAIIPLHEDPATTPQLPKDVATLCIRAAPLHQGSPIGLPRGAKILPYPKR